MVEELAEESAEAELPVGAVDILAVDMQSVLLVEGLNQHRQNQHSLSLVFLLELHGLAVHNSGRTYFQEKASPRRVCNIWLLVLLA